MHKHYLISILVHFAENVYKPQRREPSGQAIDLSSHYYGGHNSSGLGANAHLTEPGRPGPVGKESTADKRPTGSQEGGVVSGVDAIEGVEPMEEGVGGDEREAAGTVRDGKAVDGPLIIKVKPKDLSIIFKHSHRQRGSLIGVSVHDILVRRLVFWLSFQTCL